MRDRLLVDKAVRRTAELLLEELKKVGNRIQPVLAVFPDKLAIYDLVLAAFYLVLDGLNPDKGLRKHAIRFSWSALARLQNKPGSFYSFEIDLGDRIVSKARNVLDKVDPVQYYLGTEMWRDYPNPPIPVKAFRKLEPEESVRKEKPFTEQEQWTIDQCKRNGMLQGLLTMTRIITSFHTNPPRSIEHLCLSMLRKAVPSDSPLDKAKKDVLRQMVRGDESIEVLKYGAIFPVLVKGRARCFLPISVIQNSTTEWLRYAAIVNPGDSGPTFKELREKLIASDQEKQRRWQEEHPEEYRKELEERAGINKIGN